MPQRMSGCRFGQAPSNVAINETMTRTGNWPLIAPNDRRRLYQASWLSAGGSSGQGMASQNNCTCPPSRSHAVASSTPTGKRKPWQQRPHMVHEKLMVMVPGVPPCVHDIRVPTPNGYTMGDSAVFGTQ